MVKFRTIKNSYLKVTANYTHKITEEERYLIKILDETMKEIEAEGEIYYTEEEFWRMQVETEIEDYGEPISYNIYKKYA